jgi:hypothetical protein
MNGIVDMKNNFNFTTFEQSKRLIELGVPVDSADCVGYIVDKSDIFNEYFQKGETRITAINPRHTYTQVTTLKCGEVWIDEPFPCWSVGRLIELHRSCTTLPEEQYMFPFWYDTQDNVEWAIRVLESGIMTGNIDFSKLEK